MAVFPSGNKLYYYVKRTDGKPTRVKLLFSPFRQITYQLAWGSQPRFTYLGQRFGAGTGLYSQGSGSSWYDAVNGVFASQVRPGA